MTTRSRVTYELVLDSVRSAIGQVKDENLPSSALTEDLPLYAYEEAVQSSLAMDSLDALEVVSILEDEFSVGLPSDTSLEDIRTVGDLARLIWSQVEAEGLVL